MNPAPSLYSRVFKERTFKFFGKAFSQLKLRIKNSLVNQIALNEREGAG